MTARQLTLIDDPRPTKNSSTFVNNMSLPVHRWFRYSAGFSAEWAECVIRDHLSERGEACVLDPFAGSGTTLLAAEDVGVPSYGVESHPFVARLAKAKLLRQSDPASYEACIERILKSANRRKRSKVEYPELITKCFTAPQLDSLDRLRTAYESVNDGTDHSDLAWLTLVSILRACSHVGTAQWQYVLPNKKKKNVADPFDAFRQFSRVVAKDMRESQRIPRLANFIQSDARECEEVPDDTVSIVVTSPPYPNNYDYADATRLEMMFMQEISGWGDLQTCVRQHLVRSCSQHTTSKNTDLEEILGSPELLPIAEELTEVCTTLGEVRQTKGGKKNYHLMVAAYFKDLANVWIALRRVCIEGATVCFVIGDSAPYGVYVPVDKWMGRLAIAAGFKGWRFEKLRDRNTKWKNRKHRVPLFEGQLWVEG